MSAITSLAGSSVASDDDLLPIRALNDLLFCERRCVLHHREKVWVENRYTLEGTAAHRKVHSEPSDEELGGGGLKRSRSVWLRSNRLRLIGVADLIEFRPPSSHDGSRPRLIDAAFPPIPNPSSFTPYPSSLISHDDSPPDSTDAAQKPVPYPIEYKRGKRRRWDNDDVQLCAQALCLEEMLGVSVPAGGVFHFTSRRRREVPFDAELRALTEKTVARLHELLAGDSVPAPVYKPRCRGCSLFQLCMPQVIVERRRYADYVRQLYEILPDNAAK